LLGAGLAATVLVTNLILRTARDRTGPILLVALMAVLVGSPSPVAAGSEPSCDPDPSIGRLDVTVPAGWVVGPRRDQAGVILMNNAACGRATVTNVDRVRVVGDEGLQWLQIDLANGGFAPGKTNEPGDSDEVEFTILLGTGGDRVQGDHDHALGAKRERGLDRGVQPRASVEVPAGGGGGGGNVGGGEDTRDGRRGEHVLVGQLRAYVVDPPLGVRRGQSCAAVEDDTAAGVGRGRDDGGSLQRARRDVALQLFEGHDPPDGVAQRCRVQQRLEPHARYAEDLAEVADDPRQRAERGDRLEYLLEGQLGPDPQAVLDHALGGLVGSRCQVRGVERAHARAHDDPWPLAAALEVGEQHRQGPKLVGAAGSAARQHEPDRLSLSRAHRWGHWLRTVRDVGGSGVRAIRAQRHPDEEGHEQQSIDGVDPQLEPLRRALRVREPLEGEPA